MWSVSFPPISPDKKDETLILNWRTKYIKEWLLSRSSAESTRDWEEGRDCLAHCMGIDPSRTWGNLSRADKITGRNSTFQGSYSTRGVWGKCGGGKNAFDSKEATTLDEGQARDEPCFAPQSTSSNMCACFVAKSAVEW